MNFKDRQIEIWKEEQKLHSKTQELLVDLLKSLTPEQLEKVTGIEIDEYSFIDKITPDGVTIGEHVLDEEDYYSIDIEELSQATQKEIIDFILTNIVKEKASLKTKTVCANCGSTNVEVRVWEHQETGELSGATGEDNDTWCNECEGHHGIKIVEE